MYKKFNELNGLIIKEFGVDEASKKKPAAPAKKKSTPANKKSKKENKNPNQLEDEDDEAEIKATAGDTSNLNDLSVAATGAVPLLESTTNIKPSPTKNKAKKSTASRTTNKNVNTLNKFNYMHRISYTCLLKLLKTYFTYLKLFCNLMFSMILVFF